MKKSVLISFLLFHFLSFSQKLQTVKLVEVNNSTKSFGQNLVLYTKEYRVLSEDYTESKEIFLKVFKYINKPVSQLVQIPNFYNIHWGQSDFQFLFSAMDRNNPNRRLKVFQDNNIITSFRNKREFVIEEKGDGNYQPISLFIEKLYTEYQYEIVKGTTKIKEQIAKEKIAKNKAKDEKIELEVRIEALINKTHSLKEYSESEYIGFVRKYNSKVAYDLRGFVQKQLEQFKNKFYSTENTSIKTDVFQPLAVIEDTSTIRFFRSVDSKSSTRYSPFITTKYDIVQLILDKDMYDIQRACYKVEGLDRCYYVNTEIIIENFKTTLKIGVTVVKKKLLSNKLKFYEELDVDIQNKITEFLKNKVEGKYLVSYQLGYIHLIDVSAIVAERI
jgi:hypothetical protein